MVLSYENSTMNDLYTCQKCARRFKNGQALGGHLTYHQRTEKTARQEATMARNSDRASNSVTINVDSIHCNSYSEERNWNSSDSSPFNPQFSPIHKEGANFTLIHQFTSKPSDGGQNHENVSNSFCSVMVHRQGADEELQTLDLLGGLKANSHAKSKKSHNDEDLDLSLRLRL